MRQRLDSLAQILGHFVFWANVFSCQWDLQSLTQQVQGRSVHVYKLAAGKSAILSGFQTWTNPKPVKKEPSQIFKASSHEGKAGLGLRNIP